MQTEQGTNIVMVSAFPPFEAGAALYFYNLARELSKHCNVTVLANIQKNASREERIGKLKVLRTWRMNSVSYISSIVWRCLLLRPRLVHIQHEYMLYGKPVYGSLFPIILLFLRMFKIRILATVQSIVSPSSLNNDFFDRYGENSSLVELKKVAFKLVTLLVFKLSHKIVVHSNVSKEILTQEYGIAPEKIATIYHGVSGMPSISKGEAEKRLNLHGRKVILQFGFVHPKKGVEYVVSAMPRVLRECPDAFLIVAGGSYSTLADEYERYMRKLKLMINDLELDGSVSFTEGYVDEELVPYYFGLADVVVLPYLEHFGSSGVLSQVIASGKPVIVSDVNPFGEMIIHNVNGLVVPPADAGKLAESITRILSDNEFGTKLSINLKKYRTELEWKRTAMKYLKEYVF